MIYKGEITRGVLLWIKQKTWIMGYYDILLWGDDTEDERNAKIIAKETWF
jgi:hypothetical protein